MSVIEFAKEKIKKSIVNKMVPESVVNATISNIEQYALGLERQIVELKKLN